jgi:hypothetical protein
VVAAECLLLVLLEFQLLEVLVDLAVAVAVEVTQEQVVQVELAASLFTIKIWTIINDNKI